MDRFAFRTATTTAVLTETAHGCFGVSVRRGGGKE